VIVLIFGMIAGVLTLAYINWIKSFILIE